MGLSSSEADPGQSRTRVERSDRELIVTRSFDAPARILFKAWSTPELFMRWWAPKSMGVPMRSCEMDVRTGGGYRLVFAGGIPFFGKYIEVVAPSRIVWTNEEGEEGGSVTTLTLEEKAGQTLLVKHDLYPSKAALDGELASGATEGLPEQLDQLDELLATLGASAR